MEPFPLRLDDGDAFGLVQDALRNARFDEDTICRALGLESMADVGAVRRAEVDLTVLAPGALALFVRVFLFGELVSRDEVTRGIDRATREALFALDLLRPGPAPHAAETYCSPVLLYPVRGLLIASDRSENPDGSPVVAPPDVVFPALFPGTLRFLRVLPRSAAGDVLDLCAGTGVGALVLSRHAEHAVAADITARAAHFARFNCLLNHCHNVEVAQGDLYDAVPGRTFDRIIAHPPYVPATADSVIFAHAGETGETVLRRIIAGLPQYLRRGGAFYAVCAAWEAKEGPLEERVRRWLGAAHEEFDILFAMHHEMAAADVAQWLAERAGTSDPLQLSHWRQLFGKAGLERHVYGALVLDRPSEGGAPQRREPITRRLRLGAETDGSSFEWLLRWLRWRATREAARELARRLLRVAPRLSPRLRVKVTHAPQASGLAVADVVLETDQPFVAGTQIDPWMLALVARFDGQQAADVVYQSAHAAAQLPEGFGPDDFATLVALMIERGYVEASDLALDG